MSDRGPVKWNDIAIVILTGGIVFLAWMQWREMVQSGKQTDRIIAADERLVQANERFASAMENTAVQSKEALDKTLAQNKAALEATLAQNKKALIGTIAQSNKSLDASISQFRLDQRAWVTVIDISPPEFKIGTKFLYVKADERAHFKVTISNSGKTPAKNLKSLIRVVTYPATTLFKADYGNVKTRKSLSVILPGARQVMPTEIPADENLKVRQSSVDAIKQGTSVLYLFGRISYDDAVNEGDLKHHESTFCLFLNQNLEEFNNCDTYNDAN